MWRDTREALLVAPEQGMESEVVKEQGVSQVVTCRRVDWRSTRAVLQVAPEQQRVR